MEETEQEVEEYKSLIGMTEGAARDVCWKAWDMSMRAEKIDGRTQRQPKWSHGNRLNVEIQGGVVASVVGIG